jgi:ATP-binding protein involved in chromosome partitioning
LKQHKSKILKTEVLKSKIYEALAKYKDPYLDVDLITANCIKELIINNSQVILNLQYNFLLGKYSLELSKKLRVVLEPIVTSLAKEVGIKLSLEINCYNKILTHAYKENVEKIPNIKNIIAIGSGKGGVGKSTVSVNLALALKAQGARVGILDADLYGPSLPHMLGCPDQATIVNNKLQPHHVYGLYCISIGHLLEPESPVVWRGPMVSGGLLQLLHDTIWPELDYLIVDLPPGTGDIQLTLAQKIPVSGAVIVTTPQVVALLDAQKALVMLQKLQIPILGVVENMSFFVCANCNHKHDIFGTDGGSNMANKYDVRLLGNIPLDLSIRRQADLGMPTVLAFPDSSISKIYHNIATSMAAQLSKLSVDLKLDRSQIVIES